MLRIDDPTDNDGRGWKRLSEDELASLIYMSLRLTSKSVRPAYVDRNPAKVDEAVRMLARNVASRLKGYATFDPIRPKTPHSAG